MDSDDATNLQKELEKWKKSNKVLEILKNNLDEEAEDYFRKHREADKKIKKAIEYITIFKDDIRGLDEFVLLDILQGDDKE